MGVGCVLPTADWPVAYNYLGNGCEGPVIAAECSNVNCAEGYHLALDYTEVQRLCAKDAKFFVLDRCVPGDCDSGIRMIERACLVSLAGLRRDVDTA